MDDMDDFGDIYGDLDHHMRDKREGEELESMPVEVDSVKEESESHGKATTSEAKAITNFGEDNTNNSDSDDDDFHIVLNEDECPRFQHSRGVISGLDEEDELDSVSDHLNNDQRWHELPVTTDGQSTQGSEVRGVGMNGGHRPSRHVRSHLAGFPSSVRSSVPARGACDKLLVQSAASYNRECSTIAQAGVNFCLPRHKTIFDINIEVFEHKPWRHHGADITDYFNFDLDEESWRSYCQALDQCRKKTVMSNKFPAYQSSRLNQGERKFSVLESSDNGGRGFDMPKGRAIQVEGGLGERIPSTDLRRPRVLDSDVVIQINMEESVEDASALYKDSLEQAKEDIDASQSASGNNSNERVSSRQIDGQICRHITYSVEHNSLKLEGSNFRATSGKVKSKVDYNKGDEKDLFRTDACLVDVGSNSGDQVPHHSSSGNLESHSEESRGVFSTGEDARPINKSSFEDVQDSIVSDCYLSNDSLSDAADFDEQEDSKNSANERDHFSGEHKHFGRTRLKSVAEVNVAQRDELTSMVHRKHKELDLRDIRCKTRKRKSCYDTEDVSEHLYSYRETEVSLSRRSRTQAVKHGSEKYFNRDSRKGDFITHRDVNWNEEDCLAQRQLYFSERREDFVRSSSARKHSDQSVSKHKSFFKEKDSCLHLTKEREGDHCIRMDPEDYKYKERHEEGMHRRHADLYDMEGNFDFKFRRHVYPMERKLGSPERGRYDRRSGFQNRSSEYIENGVDHRLVLNRHEESLNTNERDGFDACLPGEHLPISWRSNGRYKNHRDRPNTRELQFKNKKYGPVIASINDHRHLSYEDSLGSENNGYISEGNVCSENIVSGIHVRRCNRRLAKLNIRTDNGARFRHCEQRGWPSPESFLLESSKRDEFRPLFRGQRLFGGHLLNTTRKLRVCEPSNLDSRDHANFVQDKGKHELATVGCREAVNKHLNGFKSKIAKRSSGVVGESEVYIGTGHHDSHPNNSKQLKHICKPEEAYPHMSKGENSHNHRTSLKVEKSKDSRSCDSDDHTNISLNKILASNDLEDAEIEEGELVEEPDKKDGKKVHKFQLKDSTRSGKVSGIYDNNHILQTLAKMEKRGERFKEPISRKQVPDKTMDPQVDVVVVTDEVKQERPVRKRRWGGN